MPSKKRIGIPVRNNCPYANEEVLRIVEKLRKIENQQRKVRVYFANMFSALKIRIKSQAELDQHRREGHVQYSPDCPECKRGVAKQRPHYRAECKEGGELSVDIGGPYVVGIPITERPFKSGTLYPKWLLAGALIPFSAKEAKARYEQEVRDRHAMQLEGPVQLETTTRPNSQTIYFVELLSAKSEAAAATMRMVNRIENRHKCKAVYRVHADRASELTGERQKQFLENNGVMVTSTAGYDSNSNGRAERAVQFFCTKARTMLSSNIRSENFRRN